MDFIKGATQLATVYYVCGNHEAWSGNYSQIKEELKEAGVILLDDKALTLARGEGKITLLGLADPDFYTSSYLQETEVKQIEEQLKKWESIDTFKLLLSHRPELFDIYVQNDIDLIFSGHAHGGQFRLPFIGGLVAPDQGIFPKYTSGEYQKQNSTMFVSRGLGNSIIPIRIFNRPEIVVVVLKNKE